MDGYNYELSPEGRDNLLWWIGRQEEAAMVSGPALHPAPSQLPADGVLDSAGGIIAGPSFDEHTQYYDHPSFPDNTLEEHISPTSASTSSQDVQSYFVNMFNRPSTSHSPPAAPSIAEDIDAVCEDDVGQSFPASETSHFTQDPVNSAFQDETTMHASDRRASGAYSSLYPSLPSASSRRLTVNTAGVAFPLGLHAYQATADVPPNPSLDHPSLSTGKSTIPGVRVPQIPAYSQVPKEPIRPQTHSQPAASMSYENVDESSSSTNVAQTLDRKGKRKANAEESPQNPPKRRCDANTGSLGQGKKEQNRKRGKRNRGEDKDIFESLRAVIPEEAFREFVGPQYRKYRWEVLVAGREYILDLRKKNEELQRRIDVGEDGPGL